MLLLHGEADARCPIGQSEQYFQMLKRLDKEVEMVRFPGCGHGFLRTGHFSAVAPASACWRGPGADLDGPLARIAVVGTAVPTDDGLVRAMVGLRRAGRAIAF